MILNSDLPLSVCKSQFYNEDYNILLVHFTQVISASLEGIADEAKRKVAFNNIQFVSQSSEFQTLFALNT